MSAVSPAAAQQAGEGGVRRPFRGLFAGDTGTPTADGQHMSVSFSALGAYDDNVFAGERGRTNPQFQRPGVYSSLTTGGVYSNQGDRQSLDASVTGAFRFYPEDQSLSSTQQVGSISYGTRLGRTSIQLSQLLLRAPRFGFQGFPTIDPLTDSALGLGDLEFGTNDFDVALRQVLRSASAASVTRAFGSRSSVSFNYAFRHTGFPDGGPSLTTQRGGGQYDRQLTRSASLRLGYGYRQFTLAETNEATGVHDINVGINYQKALSFSRRTTLQFDTGSAVMNRQDRTYLRLTGSADLEHEIGRTWTALVAFRRGLRFIDGFTEPAFSNSVSAQVGGLVTRRLDVSANVAYVKGLNGVGDDGTNQRFSTYAGTLTIRYALSQLLAVYTQALRYHYVFGDDIVLPEGFERSIGRSGVRFGLTSNIPLF